MNNFQLGDSDVTANRQQGEAPRAAPYPYHAQRQAALAWLGSDYLCYKPVNRKTDNV